MFCFFMWFHFYHNMLLSWQYSNNACDRPPMFPLCLLHVWTSIFLWIRIHKNQNQMTLGFHDNFPRISVHTCIEEHCKFQIKIYSTLWTIIRPFSSTRYKWKCMCFLNTVCTYFGETGLISGRYKTCFYWLYQIHWTNQSMFSYRAWKGALQNLLTRCCWHSAHYEPRGSVTKERSRKDLICQTRKLRNLKLKLPLRA